MPRTKYIYSVYDLEKKAHIAFFSSLDKAREFVLAHSIKVNNGRWRQWCDGSSRGKHGVAVEFSYINRYPIDSDYTHLYVKIPLDENGQLKFTTS
jgi:hypothetical protein